MKNFLISLFALLFFLFGNIQAQNPKRSDSTQTVKATKDSLSFLPPGTVIHARKGKRIFCFLPNNTKIQGIVYRGHRNDWETGFYKNGKLSLAWLPNDQVIQGVPCMKAPASGRK